MPHSIRRVVGAALAGAVLFAGVAFAPQAATAAPVGGGVHVTGPVFAAKNCKQTVWSTSKVSTQHACVLALQLRLNHHGFTAGTADGRFGANTKAAVARFQKANRLPADGIVGSKTSAVLCTVERRTPYPAVGFC